MSLGELLARAISANPSPATDADRLRCESGALIGRALLHRVPGPLLNTFEAFGISGGDVLREQQLDAAVASLQTLRDLEFVFSVLEPHGIELLVFKGPVLTALAEGCWERPSQDLDVLVRAEDFEAAVAALVAQGAILLDRNWQLMLDMVIGEMHLVLPSGTALDLHWNLLVKESMRVDFTPDHEGLFATSRTIDLGGTEAQTFGLPETLVYGCLHACISGGHRLVWLKDIEQIVLHDRPVWSDVVEVADAWGCSLQVGALLLRTRRELAVEVPDAVIEQLIPAAWFRSWLDLVDRRRPVAEAEVDESFLRLVTRSIGPNTRSTVRRFFLRSLKFARRRALHEDFDDPMELFEESASASAEAEYFEKVRASGGDGRQGTAPSVRLSET